MRGMTKEERWEIEGRTREQLRDIKHRVALLRADIDSHAKQLKEASDALLYFLTDPVGVGPTGMSKPEYLIHFWREHVPATIEAKLRELASETEQLRKLEKQVAAFVGH